MKYFAASTDAPATNRSFAESLALDYPILSDPAGAVARAYGVLGRAGYASRWTFYVGADGRVADIDRQVAPGSHGPAVVEKLRALGVPEVSSRQA